MNLQKPPNKRFQPTASLAALCTTPHPRTVIATRSMIEL